MKPSDQAIAMAFWEQMDQPPTDTDQESILARAEAIQRDSDAQPSEWPEPIGWCSVSENGGIAHFDGKPMFMAGPIGNYLHPTPLFTRSAFDRLLAERDAEIASLRESLHYANGCADLAMKHRDYAEADAESLRAQLAERVTVPEGWKISVCSGDKDYPVKIEDPSGNEQWPHRGDLCADLALALLAAAPGPAQAAPITQLTLRTYKDNDADFNGCHGQAVRALRYVAKHGQLVQGGEQFPNAACCLQIAAELERSFGAIKAAIDAHRAQRKENGNEY